MLKRSIFRPKAANTNYNDVGGDCVKHTKVESCATKPPKKGAQFRPLSLRLWKTISSKTKTAERLESSFLVVKGRSGKGEG